MKIAPFLAPGKFLLHAFCVLLIGLTMARADDLRLRDGTVLQADEIWERDGQIWYRQGQVIRSLPKSEVTGFGKIVAPLNVTEKFAPNRKLKAKKLTPENSPGTSPTVTPAATNTNPVTRIIFKDGTQIDADSGWEVENKIGYRLGNMYSFVDKAAISRVIPNYVAPVDEPAPPSDFKAFHFTTGHSGLDQLIIGNANKHGVDPLLIFLVMRQESSFNHRAVSRVGARGLMQLMPGTARALGVRNIDDPRENVEAGTRYLKNLLARFSGDVNLALAAYNAGEEAVARYGNRVPPYRETINYVRRIGWAYYQAKQ